MPFVVERDVKIANYKVDGEDITCIKMFNSPNSSSQQFELKIATVDTVLILKRKIDKLSEYCEELSKRVFELNEMLSDINKEIYKISENNI